MLNQLLLQLQRRPTRVAERRSTTLVVRTLWSHVNSLRPPCPTPNPTPVLQRHPFNDNGAVVLGRGAPANNFGMVRQRLSGILAQ